MSAKLYKSKRYPNLLRDESSGIYLFRKYSSIKKKEFFRSTGEKQNEARAYKLGLEMFNEWLGNIHDETGVIYFGKLARRYINIKSEDPTISEDTKYQFAHLFEAKRAAPGRKIRPRLMDGFGHYDVKQINNTNWRAWVNEIRADHPGFKMFNTRKALIEVLHYAHECGYIDKVPDLELSDEDAAPPRFLNADEIRLLFKHAHYVQMVRGPKRDGKWTSVPGKRKDGKGPLRVKNWIKLLMFICMKQGARPGEVLQYEWGMVHFGEGKHGRIHIPAPITKTRRKRTIDLNPSVSRLLRFLKPKAESRFIFPSPGNPERPISNYQKTWEGVCGRARFDAQLYWFRDTFITGKLRAGLPTVFIAKYTDTSVEMIERKYAAPSSEDFQRIAE